MTPYSRQSPSPRYQQLLEAYRSMHVFGEPAHNLAPNDTFSGQSLLPHVEVIKQLIDHFGIRSLLDYGSGKGLQYGPIPIETPDGRHFPDIPSFWGVAVSCYDPGYLPFATLPAEASDAVISTDVLEHCPEEDLDWIVGEMFAHARKLLFANVACYPADKTLPSGENAHITLREPGWWQERVQSIAARHPGVQWLLRIEERLPGPDGKPAIRYRYAGSISVG